MSRVMLGLALAGVVSAGVYAYVGTLLARRSVSDEAAGAWQAFVAWWFWLAAASFVNPVMVVLFMTGTLTPWLHHTLAQISLGLVFLALTGLIRYLLFVYKGPDVPVWPIKGFFLALFGYVLALAAWTGTPVVIRVADHALEATYARAFPAGHVAVLLVLLVVPALGAALAYMRLFWKVEARTQRYRIAMVSIAIVVWFGASLVAQAVGASGTLTWRILSQAIAVTASLVILAAYLPPNWVRARYGIEAIRSV